MLRYLSQTGNWPHHRRRIATDRRTPAERSTQPSPFLIADKPSPLSWPSLESSLASDRRPGECVRGLPPASNRCLMDGDVPLADSPLPRTNRIDILVLSFR